MVYSCNLCGLCADVCPVDLDTGEMLLEARRHAVRGGIGPLAQHRPEVRFFHLSVSWPFTLAMAEPGRQRSRRLFFTGCNLPGTAPDLTIRLYDELCRHFPGTGVLMHCCGLPAAVMGMEEEGENAFREIERLAEQLSAEELIVACPGCQLLLGESLPDLEVRSVWELLADCWQPPSRRDELIVTVHDPCRARRLPAVRRAVRSLLRASGAVVEELEYSGSSTRCCGFGGRIARVNPGLYQAIGNRRARESTRPAVTYCSSCRSTLRECGMDAVHLLEFLLAPDPERRRASPRSGVMRYINRLRTRRAFLGLRPRSGE